MVDSRAAVSVCPLGCAPEIPMTNHSRRGAQIEHAGQKTVEYEISDGGSVNVSFEVADVTRPLVAVGELLKRECDFMFLSSRVHLVNPGLTILNMMDRESQSMAAALTVKAASETLVRFFLAMLDAWERSDVKVLLRSD